MVFFLIPRNKMTKPKISNRRKQLLERMRNSGRPILTDKKQFIFNQMLINEFLENKKNRLSSDPVIRTGGDLPEAPVTIVESLPFAESIESLKAKKTNSEKMTILKRLFEEVENLPFSISSRITKPEMNAMVKFLETEKALNIEYIYQIKALKNIDQKVDFIYENIDKINLPKKYGGEAPSEFKSNIGQEETKAELEPKSKSKSKSKYSKR